MKSRLISAFVMLLICVPIILIGGTIFKILCLILTNFALYEFIKIKQKNNILPNFIKFISYILVSLILFLNINKTPIEFIIDYKLFCGLFMMYLIPVILYHDKKIYNINDAFYMIGGVLFIGISFSLITSIRNQDLLLLIYLILIATITDAYALITGLLIGKHKMIKEISPKKTIEGMLGGTFMGVFISVLFYHTFIDNTLPIYIIIIVSTFLSILGQLGDLCFSAIKRYYDEKDFSNLIPGHGGILDRLDSIIFIVLGFMFFISII